MEQPKVSVVMPIIITEKWQEYVTEACIRVHRENTNVPFELIIVETLSDKCKGIGEDKYLHHNERTGYAKDFNSGIDVATGDFIVHTANDVFPQLGWLEALLECFEIADCGVALLGSKELRHVRCKKIIESMSSPQLMMFRKGHKFDEYYKNVMVDMDLIMQLYTEGFRSYRNLSVLYHHLGEMTVTTLFEGEAIMKQDTTAIDYFRSKFQNSPLVMYRIMESGQLC